MRMNGGSGHGEGRADACLDEEALLLFEEGRLDADERERRLAHAASCERCLDRLAAVGAAAVPLEAVDAGRRRIPAWTAAAAGAAILLAGGALLLRRAPEERPPVPAARRVAWAEGRLAPGERVELPDVSRLLPLGRAAARLVAPLPGERGLVVLERGAIEAQVAPGGGCFRIRAEAGEIEVVGTAFTARAFRIRQEERGLAGEAGGIPVLSVEVTQGAVDLVGRGVRLRVGRGRRGILREGAPPLLQEVQAIPWHEAAMRWGRGAGDAEGVVAGDVILLSGGWKGIRDWEDALSLEGAPVEARRVAARLAGSVACAEDRDRLAALLRFEADEEVRWALFPQLVRISGDRAEAWLEDVASLDRSERIRARAKDELKAFRERR